MKKILCVLIVLIVLVAAFFAAVTFYEPLRDALPIDQSGWEETDGNRFYLNEKGDPLTGWQEIDGNRMYFGPDGALASGWQEIDGSRYYLDENGMILTGWQEIQGQRYYLSEAGTIVTGWIDTEEGRYYLTEEGKPHTGWLTTEEGRFFLDGKGNPFSGWITAEEGRYYLDENGAVTTGWINLEDGSYYLDENGILVSGWQEIDGKRAFLDAKGQPATGWQEIDGSRYYLDEKGIASIGWQEIDGKIYYFKDDGTMARGRVEIDGENYYFTSTGANILLVNRWNVLDEDYEPENMVTLDNGGTLSKECADALDVMLDACRDAGFNPRIYSTTRTFAHQKRLLNQKVSEYGYDKAIQIVAIPGTSEHHTGLAVDIVDASYNHLNHEQAKRPTQKWLMEHCWEYGFIVRYPDDTTEITGIIYEPWHYRYVGLELALEMRDNGLCLEEYLDQLTNDGTTCGNPDILK